MAKKLKDGHSLGNYFVNDPGLPASAILRVANNVAEDETVTIDGCVYDIEIVNTDSTDVSGALLTNTTDPVTIDIAALTALVAVDSGVGDLWRCENEIMRIIAVDGTNYTLQRGVSGTTTASHTTNAIYHGDGHVGDIGVGLVATLTPTVYTAALVDDINNIDFAIFPTAPKVTAVLSSVNEVFIYTAVAPGGDPIGRASVTVAEALAGASNEWETTLAGRIQGRQEIATTFHAVTAGEATAVEVSIAFPFTIAGYLIDVRDAAGNELATPITDVWTATGPVLKLETGGATHIASGDVIGVIAWS